MRTILIACVALLYMASCSSYERTPDFVTYKMMSKDSVLHNEQQEFYNNDSDIIIGGRHPHLDSLIKLQHLYFNSKNQFDIAKYIIFWDKFVKEKRNRELTRDEVTEWVELTGFLFQLTAKAEIAEELEQTVYRYLYYNSDGESNRTFIPYVFTRHTDKIHLNLYMPAQISFTHSLGGLVTIRQETDFSKTGRILLVFGMETKQFVELYVRIPSWADNASVSVRGVKYLAIPGSYSYIAKKWKDGDEVEILVPIENLPAYFNR